MSKTKHLDSNFEGQCEECQLNFIETNLVYQCDICKKWICFDCYIKKHENHSNMNEFVISRGILGELEPLVIAPRAPSNEIIKKNDVTELKTPRATAVQRAIQDDDGLGEYREIERENQELQGDSLIQGDIKSFLEKLKGPLEPLPKKVIYKKWCSPVYNQGKLKSSAAFAAVGIVEYLENQFYGKFIEASPLFLYKVARNFLHETGDLNVLPRTIVGALVLFGVPPEEYWPYTDKSGADPDGFDREPSAFCYSFAQNYKVRLYTKIDQTNTLTPELVDKIKTAIANEIPSILCFDIYESIWQDITNGKIPYPQKNEKLIEENHSVMIIGYDDSYKIKNQNNNKKTKGAFLIKNSWGTDWGDDGYGWLPYEYILKRRARDCWLILMNKWVDLDEFQH